MSDVFAACLIIVAGAAVVESVVRVVLACKDYQVKEAYRALIESRNRQIKAAEKVQEKLRQMAAMDDAWEPCDEEEGTND